jgi:toxin ParE1/3/4
VKLRWSQPALRDLREVRDYIARDNPGAALATVVRIRRTGERIEHRPGTGERIKGTDLRVTTVPGTPYRLIYQIEGEVVLVTAVWHGARKWPFD